MKILSIFFLYLNGIDKENRSQNHPSSYWLLFLKTNMITIGNKLQFDLFHKTWARQDSNCGKCNNHPQNSFILHARSVFHFTFWQLFNCRNVKWSTISNLWSSDLKMHFFMTIQCIWNTVQYKKASSEVFQLCKYLVFLFYYRFWKCIEFFERIENLRCVFCIIYYNNIYRSYMKRR